MFCRKCGTELKDEWQVCPKCGEPVPKDNEENITEQSREVLTDNKAENTEHFGDSATQSTYVSNNKKNNNGIIIGVVVGVVDFRPKCPVYRLDLQRNGLWLP